MNFFLTGGGDFHHFSNVDRQIKEYLKGRDAASVAKVQIIPYAAEAEDYPDLIDRVEITYGTKGVSLEVELNENPLEISEENLLAKDLLYFEGGNTFDLVTTLRESNLATLVKKYSATEGGIYADSAGAIVLGSSVKTAFFGDDADEDEKRLQDYRGLDVLNGWSVHCHYTPEDDDSVMDLVYESGMPVMALSEESGIFLDASWQVMVLGQAKFAVFTAAGKESFDVGQKLTLSDYF